MSVVYQGRGFEKHSPPALSRFIYRVLHIFPDLGLLLIVCIVLVTSYFLRPSKKHGTPTWEFLETGCPTRRIDTNLRGVMGSF